MGNTPSSSSSSSNADRVMGCLQEGDSSRAIKLVNQAAIDVAKRKQQQKEKKEKRKVVDESTTLSFLLPNDLLFARDALGNTLVHICCYLGEWKVLKSLLEQNVPVWIRNNEGNTPLHLASYQGFHECVGLLLLPKSEKVENNSNLPNAQNEDLDTPLHLAAMRNNAMVVQLLLDAHADATMTNKQGMTPLHYAAGEGRVECVRLLFDAAPDVLCERNTNGQTPFFLAARCHGPGAGMAAAAQVISQTEETFFKGYRQHQQISNNSSSSSIYDDTIVKASRSNVPILWSDDEIISIFLHRPDLVAIALNIPDHRGNTPLHAAVRYNKAAMVRRLVRLGANPSTPNSRGVDCRDLARRARRADIGRILVRGMEPPDDEDLVLRRRAIREPFFAASSAAAEGEEKKGGGETGVVKVQTLSSVETARSSSKESVVKEEEANQQPSAAVKVDALEGVMGNELAVRELVLSSRFGSTSVGRRSKTLGVLAAMRMIKGHHSPSKQQLRGNEEEQGKDGGEDNGAGVWATRNSPRTAPSLLLERTASRKELVENEENSNGNAVNEEEEDEEDDEEMMAVVHELLAPAVMDEDNQIVDDSNENNESNSVRLEEELDESVVSLPGTAMVASSDPRLISTPVVVTADEEINNRNVRDEAMLSSMVEEREEVTQRSQSWFNKRRSTIAAAAAVVTPVSTTSAVNSPSSSPSALLHEKNNNPDLALEDRQYGLVSPIRPLRKSALLHVIAKRMEKRESSPLPVFQTLATNAITDLSSIMMTQDISTDDNNNNSDEELMEDNNNNNNNNIIPQLKKNNSLALRFDDSAPNSPIPLHDKTPLPFNPLVDNVLLPPPAMSRVMSPSSGALRLTRAPSYQLPKRRLGLNTAAM